MCIRDRVSVIRDFLVATDWSSAFNKTGFAVDFLAVTKFIRQNVGDNGLLPLPDEPVAEDDLR